MDLYAWVPFEGRGGQVVVGAHAHDGRVGVEAGENGVAYEWHCFFGCRCIILFFGGCGCRG